MSRKYKFHNPDGLYFVSFATIYWLDVFVRDIYCYEIVENLDYCRQNKGTTQAAAEFLGCSRPHVVNLLENGEILFTKVGKHGRIRYEDVARYRKELKSKQGKPFAK